MLQCNELTLLAVLFILWLVVFLVDVYKEIFKIHNTAGTIYKFSAAAKEVYQKFSNEIATKMNKQLQEGIMVKNNMSKGPFIKYRKGGGDGEVGGAGIFPHDKGGLRKNIVLKGGGHQF